NRGRRPSPQGYVPNPCRHPERLHGTRNAYDRGRGISLSGEGTRPAFRRFVQQSHKDAVGGRLHHQRRVTARVSERLHFKSSRTLSDVCLISLELRLICPHFVPANVILLNFVTDFVFQEEAEITVAIFP